MELLKSLCLLFAASVLALTEISAAKDTLRFVSVLSRHGARSPAATYPKDPHVNYPWHGGLGALSAEGVSQTYSVGKKFKRRYQSILPADGLYRTSDIYIRSSDVERCLQSVESIFAGLLVPQYNPLPLAWQPVPVHTIPTNLDTLIAQLKPCPVYDNLLRTVKARNFQSAVRTDSNLISYLSANTGYNITSLDFVLLTYDILLIERDNNLPLPAWTQSVFPDKLLPYVETFYTQYTEEPLMKQALAGPFLTDLVDTLRNKSVGTLSPDRKLVYNSGHDLTLVTIANALGVINQTSSHPGYVSALAFELHDNPKVKNDLELKLFFFKDWADEKPKQISIPNCAAPCATSTFAQSISNLIVRDFDSFCQQ